MLLFHHVWIIVILLFNHLKASLEDLQVVQNAAVRLLTKVFHFKILVLSHAWMHNSVHQITFTLHLL